MIARISMIPLAIVTTIGGVAGYIWQGLYLGFLAGTDWAERHIDGPNGREPE